nr:ribonuclease H-like domain-containing protein [Tanacetum cinerariifolium]
SDPNVQSATYLLDRLVKDIGTESDQFSIEEFIPLLRERMNVSNPYVCHFLGDYEMWKLRIEQYYQVQDYPLWDVIENGNSFKPVLRTTANADGTSTSTIPGLVTTEEKAQKKNDVKARSMLLMALPNENLLTYSQYKDAKTLFEAIQARFVGNDAIKKIQRTLLKQMYENFNAQSTESFDSIFNSIQVIDVSTLVSTVSSPNNTANLSDAIVYAFLANQPNGSQLVHEVLEKIHEDDLEKMDLKWKLALLSMRVSRECKSPKNQESQPMNQDSSRKTVIVEDTSSKAMMAIDGAGFDWSYMADDEVPTNMALMDFLESDVQNSKTCSNTCLKSYETLKT